MVEKKGLSCGHSQDALFSLECGEGRQGSSLVPLFLKVFKKQSQAGGRDKKGEIEGSPEQHRKWLRVSIWSQKILCLKER